MAKKFRPIFVTGTGTDIGKTYVTALLCKALKEHLLEMSKSDELSSYERLVSYYKAAISGADDLKNSDAGYVNDIASLGQDLNSLTTYLFKEAVSPHLAVKHAKEQDNSVPDICLKTIMDDFFKVYDTSALTVLEGSGGMYCPLSWDLDKVGSDLTKQSHDLKSSSSIVTSDLNKQCFTIVDFMRAIEDGQDLSIVVVADGGLGTINNVVMTLNCLKMEGFDLNKVVVILNNFKAGDPMYEDNLVMIEAMTKVPVIG